MMKRGQIMGQIFIMVVAALVFILVIMYGYRAIKSFIARSDETSLIDFKTELESSIDIIKTDFGSRQQAKFVLPKKYTEVCILSTAEGLNPSSPPPLYNSAWKTRTENVFLVPKQETPIWVDDVEVAGGNYWGCFNIVNGRLNLWLEGKGDRVIVSA